MSADKRAARATVVNYLVIALSVLYSLFLGESLQPTAILGMGLIVLAISTLTRDVRNVR